MYGDLEAIDSLVTKIDTFDQGGIATTDTAEHLICSLKDAKMYLWSDYKAHIDTSTNVADHCSTYSLSDPEKIAIQKGCDHEHALQCTRCTVVEDILTELQDFLQIATFSSDTDKDKAIYLIDVCWKYSCLETASTAVCTSRP